MVTISLCVSGNPIKVHKCCVFGFFLMNLPPEDPTLHPLPSALVHQEDPEKDRKQNMLSNL